MSQHFTYKHVLTRLYPPDVLANRSFGDAFVVLPDGRLTVQFGTPPDVIDLGIREPIRSVAVLRDRPGQEAITPDGHYRVEIDTYEQGDTAEFWLIHINQVSGKFKRAKLSAASRRVPRIAASPGGTFFLADDCGTIRLYDALTLHGLGVFEAAHAATENRIAALAVSADDRFVAALSSWKDFVLYHVPERRVVAVRHIDDPAGWYDQAFILIAAHGAAIVTAGRIVGQNAAVSVNGYRYISQDAWRKREP
jgi:hypothetical protein